MRLKISDFGEAYKRVEKESSRYCCSRYAAPEIWEYFEKISEDSEGISAIFLFAVVNSHGAHVHLTMIIVTLLIVTLQI